MKLVRFLLSMSRGTVILAILVSLISGISSTGFLAIIHRALSSEQDSRSGLAWPFAALCLVVPLAKFGSSFLLIRLGQQTIFNMRLRLSRQILRAPLQHLESIGAPRLMAALTDDVLTITNTTMGIPVLCINIAVLTGCLSYLGWVSWPVLLVVLACMVLGAVSYRLPVIAAMRYVRLAREEQDTLFKHFRALTEGGKELRLHSRRRHAFLSQLLQPSLASYQRYNLVGMTVYSAANSWGTILAIVLIGVVLFAFPLFMGITNQALIGAVLIILYLLTPFEVVLNALPMLGRANVALKKVESLGLSLASLSTDQEASISEDPKADWEVLEVVGVTHTYNSDDEENSFILGPIDLTATRGELVFITGGNGSGKTTLAKLLTGLYVPASGEIRVDGKPVNDSNREQYRQYFTAVFFDFYLFESLLGLDVDNLDGLAGKYLDQFHIAHKVQVRDGVLSTTDLSHGQRKRLALLTAYLEDRSIYVFDEWAADQDPFFREIFYLQLLPELKARGKTVFVITHDDRYYCLATRVIKLEMGKVEGHFLQLPRLPEARVDALHFSGN